MPGYSRVRLSVGASAVRTLVACALGVPAFSLVALLLWIVGGLLVESLSERPINVWGSLLPHILVGVLMFPGIYLLAVFGLAMLGMVMHAAWAKGTLLGERRFFRTRWVDLVDAEIVASYDQSGRRMRHLIARSQTRPVNVKIPVSQGPYTLPAAELMILANAITCKRERTSEGDNAFAVADQLRALAAANDSGSES